MLQVATKQKKSEKPDTLLSLSGTLHDPLKFTCQQISAVSLRRLAARRPPPAESLLRGRRSLYGGRSSREDSSPKKARTAVVALAGAERSSPFRPIEGPASNRDGSLLVQAGRRWADQRVRSGNFWIHRVSSSISDGCSRFSFCEVMWGFVCRADRGLWLIWSAYGCRGSSPTFTRLVLRPTWPSSCKRSILSLSVSESVRPFVLFVTLILLNFNELLDLNGVLKRFAFKQVDDSVRAVLYWNLYLICLSDCSLLGEKNFV